jgi:predicted TIM-barrel fold metal-dependent hydrolase
MKSIIMGYIDSHTHVWFKEAISEEMRKRSEIVGYRIPEFELKDILKEMDDAELEYITIIAYPSRELWGIKEDFPLRIIEVCKEYPDRFAVIGGVEVNKLSIQETKTCLEKQYEAGVSGFKLHPPHMWIKPNDYREEEGNLKQLELLYDFAQDNNLPVIIHSGTSMFLTARNKYADPIFVDDVSVDFPRLNIIIAHAGRPNWVNTAFQLIRIRKNIYTDLSSIPPKRVLEYLPRLEEINEKALYGSDFGAPGTKSLSGNLKEFLKIPLSETAIKNITKNNPRKMIKTLG